MRLYLLTDLTVPQLPRVLMQVPHLVMEIGAVGTTFSRIGQTPPGDSALPTWLHIRLDMALSGALQPSHGAVKPTRLN